MICVGLGWDIISALIWIWLYEDLGLPLSIIYISLDNLSAAAVINAIKYNENLCSPKYCQDKWFYFIDFLIHGFTSTFVTKEPVTSRSWFHLLTLDIEIKNLMIIIVAKCIIFILIIYMIEKILTILNLIKKYFLSKKNQGMG